jgi:hypothetical protein
VATSWTGEGMRAAQRAGASPVSEIPGSSDSKTGGWMKDKGSGQRRINIVDRFPGESDWVASPVRPYARSSNSVDELLDVSEGSKLRNKYVYILSA